MPPSTGEYLPTIEGDGICVRYTSTFSLLVSLFFLSFVLYKADIDEMAATIFRSASISI